MFQLGRRAVLIPQKLWAIDTPHWRAVLVSSTLSKLDSATQSLPATFGHIEHSWTATG